MTLRGVRLTDVSAAGGGVLWVMLVLLAGLDPIARAIALAPLVLVPLALGVVGMDCFPGSAGRIGRITVVIQPVCAALVAVSLAAGGVVAVALAVPWLALAGLSTGVGMLRLSERGISPPSEVLVDAGLLYLPVGAGALVGAHAGITLGFDPVIVSLTAVHFHYAGFVLPVVAGMTGRALEEDDGPGSRLFSAVAAVIAVGPGLIAVGITFSPLVEVLAVGTFTLAVTVFGGLLAPVARNQPPSGAVLLTVSALALPVSMALAPTYGIGAFVGTFPLELSIGRMVLVHGSLNAYGFGLCALLGWWFSGND